jgi:hypothetical protein
MAAAHAKAEGVRAQAGYSGGVDGSQYMEFPKISQGPTGNILVPPTSGVGGNVGTYLDLLNPNNVTPKTPTADGLTVGDKYGITYDYNTILGILNNATKASYDLENQKMTQTENAMYGQMNANQASALDTLRKSQSQAIATGASKGISAANELSSILNLQGGNTQAITDMANQKNNLSAQEQAAVAKNAQTALDTSNTLKQGIANIDLTKYGYDTQHAVGILDYLANLAQTAGGMYDSDNTLTGVKYNADQNLAGTQYTADKNTEASKYNADSNLAGSKYTADQNLAGTKYNADYGYGGSKNPSYGKTVAQAYNGASGSGSSGSSSGSTNKATGGSPTTGASFPSFTLPTGEKLTKQADGTYNIETWDPTTKQPIVKTGVSAQDAAAMQVEGTTDVGNKDYAKDIMGTTDPVKVYGKTYTYDPAGKTWKAPDGTPVGSKTLRSWQADDNMQKVGTGSQATVTDADANANPNAFERWKATAEKMGSQVWHVNGKWIVMTQADIKRAIGTTLG